MRTANVNLSHVVAANKVHCVADFVTRVDTLMDAVSEPHAIVAAVEGYLHELLSVPDLLTEEQRCSCADHYQSHVVAVAPSRRFSVVSLVWLPGQTTCIHDHLCWCVVGVLEGKEYEQRYSLREDNTGNRWLAKTGDWYVSSGGVTSALIPPDENIHRVCNAGDEQAISLHIYGADIEFYGSSINERFDELPIRLDDGQGQPIAWRQMR